MYLTWTALQLAEPTPVCPWRPRGAAFVQSGQAGAGVAEIPDFAGTWWSVLALWDDRQAAAAAAPAAGAPGPGRGGGALGAAWHVVLQPVSYRGDAVLAHGARPFDRLPARGKVAGAAAVVTLAGLSADPQCTGEFFERFAALGKRVRDAPGSRAALVQAPEDGAVLTFSAWRSLRDAVTWAYHRPHHAGTVARQNSARLLDGTGFLRCAVLGSAGTLHGTDPLAGLTGVPVRPEEDP